jgi:hypothetical protein
MGCIALVRCVLVLRCGSAGVVWCPYAGWGTASDCIRIPHHTTPAEPRRNTNTYRTRAINTWNKSTISRKLLKMDVLTFETCWAVNSEIIKQVTSRWSLFIHLSKITVGSGSAGGFPIPAQYRYRCLTDIVMFTSGRKNTGRKIELQRWRQNVSVGIVTETDEIF